MKRSLAAVSLMAVTALTLVGCTDSAEPSSDDTTTPADTATDDATDAADDATEEATDAGEVTQIRVAALPISETGALWAAIEEGIFEKHGLEVEIVPAQGGAQAIPALLSGDIDFAIGQPFGPIRANLQDLGAVIVGNYSSALLEGKDVNAVVAMDSSGIDGPADLAGKRVAVNSLGAAGDVTIMAAVEDAGGDPTTIEFVEVAFPDAPAQLESGNIDAAWVPDPFMTMVDNGAGHIVVHPYQATIPGLSLLTNITLQKTIDENRDLVESYSAAMEESLSWASENEEAVRAAIASNMGIPAEAAAGITLPEFTWELNTGDIEQLVDLAVGFGVLDQAPDFGTLIQIF